MGDVVVVLRRPDRAVGLLQVDRLVGERRGQRPASRLRQRHQVGEGLDDRTDRPVRVQRPVEAGLAGVATADHGQHPAVAGIGDHHGGLQVAAARPHAIQGVPDRPLGVHLGGRVQGGEDRQAVLAQGLLVEIGSDLRAHQVHERGEAVARQLRVGHHAQRLGLGVLS